MRPLVSVVIPFYNQAQFAADAIESVLAQDYPNTQLILADDASTDGTQEVLRAYARSRPDQVLVSEAEVNQGIAGNINRGLALAQGELVAWLGGDDLMLPGKLARQVEVLAENPAAVACVHDAEVFVSETGDVLGRFSKLYNGRPGVRSGGIELMFDPAYYMLPSTMLFRRGAAPEHGFDARLRFANDWLWAIELLRHGSIVGLQDVLVRYRRHGANMTADPSNKARILEEGLIVLAIVDARYPELHRLVRRRAAGLHFSAARDAAVRRQPRLVARHLAVALAEGGAIRTPVLAARLLVALARRGRAPG
jgi:glycosyltransferase involved in cell wall biosynthesis